MAIVVGEAVAEGVPVAKGVGLSIANGVGSTVIMGAVVGVVGCELGAKNIA